MLVVLLLPLVHPGLHGLARRSRPPACSGLGNAGPHGFSEILYAYSSAAGNNGSAFAGLGANTPFYNVTLGLAMLIGRFLMIVPDPRDRRHARRQEDGVRPGPARCLRHGPLFTVLLVGVIVDRRGAHLLPRPGARPDRRAPPDAVGKGVS